MKQTAIEWFAEQVEQHVLTFGNIQPNVITKLKNLSKAMEKEQIIMAHCHNRCLNNKTYECSIKAFENSEHYYNETYNKEKLEREL